jgi:hypothetical protein
VALQDRDGSFAVEEVRIEAFRIAYRGLNHRPELVIVPYEPGPIRPGPVGEGRVRHLRSGPGSEVPEGDSTTD